MPSTYCPWLQCWQHKPCTHHVPKSAPSIPVQGPISAKPIREEKAVSSTVQEKVVTSPVVQAKTAEGTLNPLAGFKSHVLKRGPFDVPNPNYRFSADEFITFLGREQFEYLIDKGWVKLSPQNLETIAQHSPQGVVEIGAGSGFVAYCLSGMDVNIVAFDIKEKDLRHSTRSFFPTWPDTPWFAQVQDGSYEVAGEHAERTLLLVWPKGDVAVKSLQSYAGTTLIYVGEQKGGLTADSHFFEALEADWNLVESQDVPNFPHCHSKLFVFKRKGPEGNAAFTFSQEEAEGKRVIPFILDAAKFWLSMDYTELVAENLARAPTDPRLDELKSQLPQHVMPQDPFCRGDWALSRCSDFVPDRCPKCRRHFGKDDYRRVWSYRQMDFRPVLRCEPCQIQNHAPDLWSCCHSGDNTICWRPVTAANEYACAHEGDSGYLSH